MKMNGLDRTMTAFAAMLLMCLPASAAETADTASANGMAKGEKTEEQAWKLPYDGKRISASAYFKDGKIHFESKDRKFHIWLDNRIYTDASFYIPTQSVDGLASKINKDLEEDDGIFRFSNGVSIRRARFAIKAELFERWFAEFDLDFAYNEVEIKDMYLGYKFSDHLSVQAGHFKEPMSLEAHHKFPLHHGQRKTYGSGRPCRRAQARGGSHMVGEILVGVRRSVRSAG